MEEAAAREVMEESGIIIESVKYHSSQPWPFPSQLMLACSAVAFNTDITIDRTELEDARWFSKDDVVKAVERDPCASFTLPPDTAIAFQLLKSWANRSAENLSNKI